MKTNNLLEFYTDVLNTLKIKISSNSGLYIPTNGSKGKLPFTLGNKQMYLPTKEVIKTSLEPDENNKLQVVKELFNPIDESAEYGDTKSLLRLKDHVERLLNNAFAVAGEVLFKVITDEKIEINDMYILEVITALNKKKTSGRKNMVDEGTIKAFTSIYKNRISKLNKLYLHTFLKRGGVIKGIQYNRIGVLSFPVLEEILNLNKESSIDNIKLRLKDKDAFEVLHTAIFNSDKDSLINGIQFTSKDMHAPAFVVLLKIYDYVSTNINHILDGLISLDVDTEFLKETKLNSFPFKISDLEEILKEVQPALKEVPSSISIYDTATIHNDNVTSDNMSNFLSGQEDNKVNTKLYKNESSEPSASSIFAPSADHEPDIMDILSKGVNSQPNPIFGNVNNMVNTQPTLFGNQQQGLFSNNNNTQPSLFNQPTVSVVNNGWV